MLSGNLEKPRRRTILKLGASLIYFLFENLDTNSTAWARENKININETALQNFFDKCKAELSPFRDNAYKQLEIVKRLGGDNLLLELSNLEGVNLQTLEKQDLRERNLKALRYAEEFLKSITHVLHPYLRNILGIYPLHKQEYLNNIYIPENSEILLKLIKDVDDKLADIKSKVSRREFANNPQLRSWYATMISRNFLQKKHNPDILTIITEDDIREEILNIQRLQKEEGGKKIISNQQVLTVVGGDLDRNGVNKYYTVAMDKALKIHTENSLLPNPVQVFSQGSIEGIDSQDIKNFENAILNAPSGFTLLLCGDIDGRELNDSTRRFGIKIHENKTLRNPELINFFRKRYFDDKTKRHRLDIIENDLKNPTNIILSGCNGLWVQDFYNAWNEDLILQNIKAPTILASAENGTETFSLNNSPHRSIFLTSILSSDSIFDLKKFIPNIRIISKCVAYAPGPGNKEIFQFL